MARGIYTVEGFQVLGRQLAAIARHAYLSRQIDAVAQATQLMLALPISNRLKSFARYYQALCTWRQGDIDRARQLLEPVVEEATPQYRARALQLIGLTHQRRGELDAALPFYLSAGSIAASCDVLTLAESQKMIAVVRSIHGDHKQALAALENLFPLVRAIAKYYPATYYDFLNSLAVELGEVGRISEADAALTIALASRLAPAYPEWSETRQELEAKRASATPSVVAVNRTSEVIPTPQMQPQPCQKPKRAVVFCWLGIKRTSLQTALVAIARFRAIASGRTNRKTLVRLGRCIRSRAPPARA